MFFHAPRSFGQVVDFPQLFVVVSKRLGQLRLESLNEAVAIIVVRNHQKVYCHCHERQQQQLFNSIGYCEMNECVDEGHGTAFGSEREANRKELEKVISAATQSSRCY